MILDPYDNSANDTKIIKFNSRKGMMKHVKQLLDRFCEYQIPLDTKFETTLKVIGWNNNQIRFSLRDEDGVTYHMYAGDFMWALENLDVTISRPTGITITGLWGFRKQYDKFYLIGMVYDGV